MTNPKIMCNNHLLGEHHEIHMFVGAINKGISLRGYIRNNCFEYKSIIRRHNRLMKEMKKRGMKHKIPLPDLRVVRDDYILKSVVDRESSLRDLLGRCSKCSERYNEISDSNGQNNQKSPN